MSAPLVWYVGDRNPSIAETITAGGAPVDLTGYTVRFKMRPIDSSTGKVDQPALIVAAAAGQVRYDWAAVDVDTEGFFLVRWEATAGDGKKQHVREAVVEFRAFGPQAGALTTLEEAKEQLEIATAQRENLLRMLVPAASAAIADRCHRELAPRVASATRSVRARARVFSLAPYDLRALTTVRVDPAGAADTLAAADYQLAGPHPLTGTVQALKLARGVALEAYTAFSEFGEVEVELQGSWGAWNTEDVPDSVRRACVVTVGSWLDRAVAEYGAGVAEETDSGLVPVRARTWGIPRTAYDLLQNAGLIPLQAY